MKRITECDYLVESIYIVQVNAHRQLCTSTDLNCVNLAHDSNTMMMMASYGQMLITQLISNSRYLHISLEKTWYCRVDIDDVPMAKPGRVRRPPSRFADFVSH